MCDKQSCYHRKHIKLRALTNPSLVMDYFGLREALTVRVFASQWCDVCEALIFPFYKLNIVMGGYQSHNPQYCDSSWSSPPIEDDRLPHHAVVIPARAHTSRLARRWKEIIILKFNLFLSNICTGALREKIEWHWVWKNICATHRMPWKALI